MNDNELERRLRSEPGPREQGYVARSMPMTPDGFVRPARSTPLRMAVLAPAVAGGIVAVAAGAALLSAPGDRDGVGDGPSPTSIASTPGGSRVCRTEDVALAAEAWGGAAGSRGTVVSMRLANGRRECVVVPTEIAARISEGNGNVLITSGIPLPMSRDAAPLSAADVRSYSVVWSNWCGATPAPPVSLSISIEEGARWVTVPMPEGGADPTPPCLAENAASHLEVTPIEP